MEKIMGLIRQGTDARLVIYCLFIITLLTSVGCSSLKVIETWHKPAGQEHRYKKVLILGIARDEGKRGTFENLVADELSKHQVVAVPANTIIPVLNMDKTTHAAVVAIVKASGCDAVLTVRAMAAGEAYVTQGGESAYVYGANILSSHYDFIHATLQSSLYDVATETLMWSSTITTTDADATARVSREMGRFFFDNLRRDGLL
jgi:hypothetical protein